MLVLVRMLGRRFITTGAWDIKGDSLLRRSCLFRELSRRWSPRAWCITIEPGLPFVVFFVYVELNARTGS